MRLYISIFLEVLHVVYEREAFAEAIHLESKDKIKTQHSR